jgi:hypothetical protein
VIFQHSFTVSTNAGLELETIYVQVFCDDLQRVIARRSLTHSLESVATLSLSPTTGTEGVGSEWSRKIKEGGKRVGPTAPPSVLYIKDSDHRV